MTINGFTNVAYYNNKNLTDKYDSTKSKSALSTDTRLLLF